MPAFFSVATLSWLLANIVPLAAILILLGLAVLTMILRPRGNSKGYRHLKQYGSISPAQTIIFTILVLAAVVVAHLFGFF
jgi:hypothetical protein